MSETTKPAREFYKVLIVSPPGKGKTYSLRNLDPATTGLINAENKPLPFKNRFVHHFRPLNDSSKPISQDRVDMVNALIAYAKNPEIKVIVIDSLSAFMDNLLAEARATRKGFDVWTFYNEELSRFFTLIKRIKKEVLITCHYEILGIENSQEKRAKVKGKEWEGLIEKEFTVVLFADSKFKADGNPEYFFKLAEEGTSAKCPPDIFGPGVYKVDNDSKVVIDAIQKFAEI